MKKGRYETTYAIWYLLCKDTNANHNLKHHYLKLKLPFLNKCKLDPCLQNFLKAREGASKSMPRAILLLLISQAFNFEKTLIVHGSCEKSEQSIPFDHPKEIKQERSVHHILSALTWASLMAPPPLGPHWTLSQEPWKTAGRQRWFWGFTALHSLQDYLQLSHEAHTFPFVFPAVVTQEWESQILETLV